jgi:phage terminase large subunit-like protein
MAAAPDYPPDLLARVHARALAISSSEGLMDFIPRVSPGFGRPVHLKPLIEALERAPRQPTFVVCHAPPRHGKTSAVEHAVAYYMVKNPKVVCGYATYGAELSHSKSREMRDIARRAGVELAPDAQGVKEWRTKQGGGLLATGIGGPLTGFGVNVLFVDDPIKNRMEAESGAKKQQLMDWWRDVARTRLEPGGSAVVFATRWTPDDLSGELIRQGWKYIRLPAIADGTQTDDRAVGAALWPERYNEAALEEIRRGSGEYTWASLYQGLPRPRGGTVFHATPGTYAAEQLAEVLKRPGGFRRGIGADFAYTKKRSADHSALVTGLGVVIEKKKYVYVTHVVRKQIEAPQVAAEGKRLQEQNGRCPALAYVSSIEKGVAQLMAGYGFRVQAELAVADKFTRAQPYAATWNDGRVLLPDTASDDPVEVARLSWVGVFLAEHLSFTGSDDREDDQVDASAALHDLVTRGSAGPPPAPPPVRTFDHDARGVL